MKTYNAPATAVMSMMTTIICASNGPASAPAKILYFAPDVPSPGLRGE